MNSESWAVDEPGDLERVSSMIKQGYMMDTDAVILEEWLHK